MSQKIIKTEQLGRDYGRLCALDNVSLAIEKSRVVALLGPNGAGKTTFLHILMGLLEPTRGCARVLESNSRSLSAGISGKIGYMGDGDEPPGWTTIRQLISLQAGASESFTKQDAQELIAQRGLKKNAVFGSLSKGQKKWVRAALVLAARPELLVLDEPAEGLDPAARVELYDKLRDYVTESDATAIVATHIIGDIERIADDVAIIYKGSVVTYACLEDLREQVREVHLKGSDSVPEFGEGIEVLGSKGVEDGLLAWVRCSHEAQQELVKVCGSKAEIRTVGLETFYLAITAHNGNDK
jgi:ABC-2 type transport system ATP-binding protein